MKTKNQRNNKHWTYSEDQSLEFLVKSGKNSDEISKIMNRTRSAVFARKCKLGLTDLRITRRDIGKSHAVNDLSDNIAEPVSTVTSDTVSMTAADFTGKLDFNELAAVAAKHGVKISVVTFHS